MIIIGVISVLITIPKYIELIARPLKKVCSFLLQCLPQIIVSAGNIHPWNRPWSSRKAQRTYILQSAAVWTPKFSRPGTNNDKNISNSLWIQYKIYIMSANRYKLLENESIFNILNDQHDENHSVGYGSNYQASAGGFRSYNTEYKTRSCQSWYKKIFKLCLPW